MVMPISRTDRPGIPLPVWGILLAFLLTSCRGSSPSPTPTEAVFFFPPTAGADSIDPQTPGQVTISPPISSCTNQLQFLEDLTIPDGTEIQAGEPFTKRWLVANAGTCSWEKGYTMEVISGLSLGASQTQALYPARAGSQAVLEIIFTAPENPGRYNSWWQAFDTSRQRFGDPFYVDILVVRTRED